MLTTAPATSAPLRAPFPWFGGKSRAASLIWSGLGDVTNYVEPFAGSLATLLLRPGGAGKIETVNDLDCYVANFWRALSLAPEDVAAYADAPVNEIDLHARHRWLVDRTEFRDRMRADPEYFDAKIAGWWVWGQSAWIGSGWCACRGQSRKLPHLGDAGMGVHRLSQQLPHLGNAGMGRLTSAMPGGACTGYLLSIAARLRRTRVTCGDWCRVLTPAVTHRHGLTGVLLDPPYTEGTRGLYGEDSGDIASEVRAWAIENGDHPKLRMRSAATRASTACRAPGRSASGVLGRATRRIRVTGDASASGSRLRVSA